MGEEVEGGVGRGVREGGILLVGESILSCFVISGQVYEE